MAAEAEANAKKWIEAVTGLQFSHPASFKDSLKSGVLLCMFAHVVVLFVLLCVVHTQRVLLKTS